MIKALGWHSPLDIIGYRCCNQATESDTGKCHRGDQRTDITEARGYCTECCCSESRSTSPNDRRHQHTTCTGGDPTTIVTRDESQDCVGELLEQGLLQSCKSGPFYIFFIIFSIMQGFWGGSKPLMHCKWVKGRPRVCKPWFSDHWMHRLK